jgi:GDP-4-dehydro-6-deoxy-D-mannose reductase
VLPQRTAGNLDVKRDFLDVRDVARAYALTVLHTDDLRSGLILNIASGVPRRIGDMLQTLLVLSRVAITVEQDPARLRASDLPLIVGDATRARELLGWSCEYSVEDTLGTVLDDCRSRVARETKSHQ